MGINDRIRVAIESLGLTLREASERCEISYSSLQNWVGGHRVPKVDAVVGIGSHLGISVDWLLTGEGPMRRGEDQPPVVAGVLSPREQALLALFRELGEGDQREIQHAAEEKKRLNAIEQRVQELEVALAATKRSA